MKRAYGIGWREYTIAWKGYEADKVHYSKVEAANKGDAYFYAQFDVIPRRNNGRLPYSAWVVSVTYKNGRTKDFPRAIEGNPTGD